ncbi:hypothetical protein RvY_16069 [Ramazzottius varieornatus]|uniref:BZIP domain-containing protein n=1 Tax=Ramazzottius varieornatus TaxID=947166 RepID=A0A1D1W4Y9_RAMVA|nr:hypothetical protein RvY_16069 [Ramazzottius varieornatus]
MTSVKSDMEEDYDDSHSAVSEPSSVDAAEASPAKSGGSTTTRSAAKTKAAAKGKKKAGTTGTVQVVTNGGTNVDMSALQGTTVIMTQDGQQFLIPVSSLNGEVLTSGTANKQSSSGMSSASSSGSGGDVRLSSPMVITAPAYGQQQGMADEVGRKREVRLLKNREAAKECRRKKKEYIKCLENRVAVLENQNKALIEELKSLKELYCKSTSSHD